MWWHCELIISADFESDELMKSVAALVLVEISELLLLFDCWLVRVALLALAADD